MITLIMICTVIVCAVAIIITLKDAFNIFF